jgi:BirA family biotin operon repressor/biotin-[acetyl-CoA-carboxylase] ligase
MLCSLAVREAIARSAPRATTGPAAPWRPALKWPNDVLLNGKKVAGVLTELSFAGAELDYVVVGMGINANLDPDDLPPQPLAPATSLLAEGGGPVDRLALLLGVLEGVDRRYLALQGGRRFTGEWAAWLATLGRDVRVSEGEGAWQGVAEGVDDDGALRVRLADGSLRSLRAGDVSLRHAG